MHGPCNDGVLNWCPQFGHGKPIPVLDSICFTFTNPLTWRLHRATWRKIRDKALSEWEQSGITFEVTEDRSPPYDRTWDGSWDYYGSLAVEGTIRLIRNVNLGKDAAQDFAMYYGNKGVDGSIAVNQPRSLWWQTYQLVSNASDVGHEVGHCLGLWHRTDHGIMAGDWKPDEHDLESIRQFYLA